MAATGGHKRVPKSKYTDSYLKERRRHTLGWLIVTVGVGMALVHIIAHLADLTLLRYQDLLIGYPTAVMIALAGFILVGYRAPKDDR